MSFARYAIYFLPSDPALAAFGARWLGWNVAAGKPMERFNIPGLPDVVEAPQKYGFHATLKPPFRLAEGCSVSDLITATSALARTTAPTRADELQLTRLGRFLALTVRGDTSGIDQLAATFVTGLDLFRAPPDAAELEKRRGKELSARKEEMLRRWGYPHVLEEFRFHMTLTGRLPKADLPAWEVLLRTQLPDLTTPLEICAVSLCGERPEGHFEEIRRFTLEG